jgi:hypothetical protein
LGIFRRPFGGTVCLGSDNSEPFCYVFFNKEKKKKKINKKDEKSKSWQI